ncbi:MAG TPA: type I glutamate--ammonia ligase [Anaerolineaceae bacterium]|nr:type I glutamate--ammonia ligase [Anaerolineaceae bacterium]HPN52511.1 type I glutamate--ammonia ligase [Anaerolineaceae bacterium]
MFKDFESALDFIETNQIRMVDLKFVGLTGRWHHVTLSAKEFKPGLMTGGVGFDGSSVGLKSVKSGDMALIPDLSTAIIDPFWDTPTLSFICNTVEADTKKLFHRDPREILRRSEAFMRACGIADESRWGPEFEFYVFSNVNYENHTQSAYYQIDAVEGFWNSAAPVIPQHGGYHAIPPRDQTFQLRTRMVTLLEEAGIPVKYHHHEVGSPGQCEIETPILGMMEAADASMLIKYIVKMAAHQEGQVATFMPKPLFGEAGSGMHFHQQLFKNGINAFYDAQGPNLLSKTALYYIGGLLTHAPAVLAFTNPSTNSYCRLVPGYEAPVNCFFSSGNRSAAIRIPKYATQPEKVRFEFRPPDATCNPYLAMSAMLMAGLDGIRNQIDPTAAGFGPIDENIFAWSPERRATIKALPTSLSEALAALNKDHDFLLAGEVFDEETIQDWIKAKAAEEHALRTRPHPYEFELYFDL